MGVTNLGLQMFFLKTWALDSHDITSMTDPWDDRVHLPPP